MNLLHPVAFPGYNLRSVPYKDASSLSTPRMTTRFSWNYCNKCPLHASFSLSMPSNRSSVACQATTETEPERNHEKHKDAAATPASSNLKNSLERIDSMLRAQDSIQNKAEPAATESSDLKDSIERIDGVLENSIERTDDVLRPPDNIQKKDDEMDVASGSPLPGIKQVGEPIMIPKATIDILKDQVFGFDTFFVTSQEPYEQGVLFKGNLRGKAAKSFEKMTTRMQDRFGDQYRFFLLINPEDDEPVAVVVPDQTLQPQSTDQHLTILNY